MYIWYDSCFSTWAADISSTLISSTCIVSTISIPHTWTKRPILFPETTMLWHNVVHIYLNPIFSSWTTNINSIFILSTYIIGAIPVILTSTSRTIFFSKITMHWEIKNWKSWFSTWTADIHSIFVFSTYVIFTISIGFAWAGFSIWLPQITPFISKSVSIFTWWTTKIVTKFIQNTQIICTITVIITRTILPIWFS